MAGAYELDELMDGPAFSGDGQVIPKTMIHAVTGDEDESRAYAKINLPDGTTEIDLEINLT